MRIATLFVLATAALAGTAMAQAAAEPARTADGLVAVMSRSLDEVAVRPGVDLSTYRSVIVEPARAALRKDWLKDLNTTRGPARWLTPDDAQQITDEAAVALSAVIATVFRERGYEIAAAPAAGVLRLSPAITDLDVNAPDAPAPGIVRYFVRDAGQATLSLDVRDAVSGALLARVVDRGIAIEIRQINRATSVTNDFWFDALFRQWAAASAAVLAVPAGAQRAAAAR
jgi:hypothetical protein